MRVADRASYPRQRGSTEFGALYGEIGRALGD
jgi:hypothetical protein